MEPELVRLLAPALVFVIALVFSMLGLGGAMLYVPVFKWLELPLKTVAIPLGLLLNGATSLSAFLRYWREGLVDFRGGLPAVSWRWSTCSTQSYRALRVSFWSGQLPWSGTVRGSCGLVRLQWAHLAS